MKAPKELIEVVQDAMFEYGPDGHTDGAEEIAQAAQDWFERERLRGMFSSPYAVTHT